MKNRVIILGLDAATLDLIEPWAKAGKLRHFAKLMTQGRWGRLQSSIPAMTPVAWNTVVTGYNPGQHGVFDFVNYSPDSLQYQNRHWS